MFRNYIKKITLYFNDLSDYQKKNIDTLPTVDDIIRKNDKINTYILINNTVQTGGSTAIDQIVEAHRDLITEVKKMTLTPVNSSSEAAKDINRVLKSIRKLKFVLNIVGSTIDSEKVKLIKSQIESMETSFKERLIQL